MVVKERIFKKSLLAFFVFLIFVCGTAANITLKDCIVRHFLSVKTASLWRRLRGASDPHSSANCLNSTTVELISQQHLNYAIIILMENEGKTEKTDIFLWANQTDSQKNNLDIELFLFSKTYAPYSMPLSSSVEQQLRPLFLFDYINQVNLGAGTGLSVRDYEMSEAEENVILRTDLDKVGRAETLIHQIENERSDIVEFNEADHEFKRMKGVIAKFTDPNDAEKRFYTVKLIAQGQTLKSALAWEFNEGRFSTFSAEVGFKVPDDNQVLIIGKDIFVYNSSKFERMFGYEYKKQVIADQKVDEISKEYKLSFPEGMDLNSLVKERKKTINKLQKIEVGNVKQDQVIDYADEMQLDLMSDDDGSIIIMDGNDLDTFVNLINEDYVESKITGKRYEIKSKKLLDDPEGEPPRG